MTTKNISLKLSNLIALSFCIIALTNCDKKTIKLTGTKWKVIKVTLDNSNTLNSNELAGFNTLDSLLKSSSLYSEFKDGYVITHFDGKVPDTMSYAVKRDTLFYIQKPARDTEIILNKTGNTLVTKSLSGLTIQLEKIN